MDEKNTNDNISTKSINLGTTIAKAVSGNIVEAIVNAGIQLLISSIDNWIHRTEIAKEEINNLQTEAMESKSNLDSLNLELETTKKSMAELESKGSLSFTEENELEKLKEQNNELERNIDLESKKNKAKNAKAVAGIRNNDDTLNKDFSISLSNYKEYKKQLEEMEQSVPSLLDDGYDSDYIEQSLAEEEDIVNEKYDELLSNIDDYESNKQSLLDKYNGDVSAMSAGDRKLYDDIVSNLNAAYKEIYSDEEYNRLVIEPLFDTEGLDDAREQLFSYFAEGGKADETALRKALGDSVVNSLQQACELEGVEFPDMLQRIFNSTNDTLQKFAPKISNPNSQKDAEQNNNSDEKRKYYESLDKDTQALLMDSEIPETIKYGSLEDFKTFIENLQKNGSPNVKKHSIEDAWSSLAGTDNEEQKNTQSSLLELAKTGHLTEAAFHNTTGADTFQKSINKSLPETIDWINSLVSSSDQLSNLQCNISSIQNAFSDFRENGSASAETLAGMSDELKQLDGWDDFAETLGDSSSSAQECQQAMNDLATEYVNSNNFLSQLDETNKDYYISELSNMGVMNAEEVVTQALTNKIHALAMEKEFCAETGKNLSEVSAEDINHFINEHHYSQEAASALYRLALEKELVNGTTLDFSCDIEKIADYVNKLDGASYSLRTLNDIKNGKYSVPSSDNAKIQKNAQQEVDDVNKSDIKLNNNSKKYNPSGSTNNYKPKGSSSVKKTKQSIDWIERALERLSTKLDLLKTKYDNLFNRKKAKDSDSLLELQNKNLNNQLKILKKIAQYEGKAAKKYEKKAKSIRISEDKKKNASLKKAVQKGRINSNMKSLIATYGEDTANKIQEYQKWYDKYKEAQKKAIEAKVNQKNTKEEKYQLHVDNANAKKDKSTAWMELDSGNYKEQEKHLNAQKDYIKDSYKYQIKIANLNKDSVKASQLKAEREKELRDIEKQKFDNIQKQFKNELSVTQARQDAISREIDLIKTRGEMLDQSKYKSQIKIENEKIASLDNEKTLLEEQIKNIAKGTDEWYEANSAIEDVKANIDSSKQSISEMTKNINEIGETLRSKILDSFARLKTESDWVVDLMDKVEDFDDQTHSVTNEGIARLGSYISGSNVSEQQFNLIQQWLHELNTKRDGNGEAHFTSSITGTEINYTADEYANAWKDAHDKLRDYNSQYMDYRDKAIEWEISKLKNELSIMQDIIDAKKDALQAEKNLHDYQKSIQQSTKNIGLLQKQIAAVQSDTSQEGIARIQRLQKELTDAKDDLNETEYDRYISDQEELLDKLYQKYDELINSESKQRVTLFNRAIQDADNNRDIIVNTNQKYADILGYKFESNLQNLYGQNGSIGNNVAGILATLQNGIIVTNMQGGQPANTSAETPPQSPPASNNEQPPRIVKELVNGRPHKTLVAGKKEVGNNNSLKKLSSFKKGGIASILNKVALENGDDGWVTIQRSEGILTSAQTETFTKEFIPRMDFMMDSAKTLDNLINNAAFDRQQNPINVEQNITLDLTEVNDPQSLVRYVQTDTTFQNALRSVTIDQLSKTSSSMSVNRYR